MCFSSGLIRMRHCALPRVGWLFSFLCSGSFWLQCFQIFSQTLCLSILLLEPLKFECPCTLHCSRDLWDGPHFFFHSFSLFCSAPVISTLISSISLFFCFIHSAIDYFLGLPLLLLLQVIFQVDCLLSLYIFGFVRFNFATVSVTDCHLIFSNLLCLWFSFCRLHIYSFLWFWCLPSMEWGWSWGLCRLPGLRNWFLPFGRWS